MLLSHILARNGIESIVLERQTRAYVLARIRAGVLETGTVNVLRDAGLNVRMDKESTVHDGATLAWLGREMLYIDMKKFTGRPMVVYGQTAITRDLYEAREAAHAQIIDEAAEVSLHDIKSAHPYVTFEKDGETHRVDCDYIAGCDGSHGVSRLAIPEDSRRFYEKIYPFGWLGILSRTPPCKEVTYCYHDRGYALASQRSPTLSRYYLQCPTDTKVEDWPDERFWQEFKARCPKEMADAIITGPSIEKSVALLRSFVAEPMAYGRLFLAGDAAHIVPPTGAKGLNLAISDVHYLSRGLIEAINRNNAKHLEAYSATALYRVWHSVRFSWWMTELLHRFPSDTEFDKRIRISYLEYLRASEHAQASLSEQYVGLPL